MLLYSFAEVRFLHMRARAGIVNQITADLNGLIALRVQHHDKGQYHSHCKEFSRHDQCPSIIVSFGCSVTGTPVFDSSIQCERLNERTLVLYYSPDSSRFRSGRKWGNSI